MRMLEKLKNTSAAGFLALLPTWVVGVLILSVLAAAFLAGAKVNGQRWAARVANDALAQKTAQLEAQARAAEKTAQNAAQSAQLDKTYYEEFQNATKNSDDWRARYLTKRVPSRTKAANCAETRSSTGVGDDAAADIGADRSVDVRGAAIIELSESAKQMRAQVLYFQGKKSVDDVTVNGENDATK